MLCPKILLLYRALEMRAGRVKDTWKKNSEDRIYRICATENMRKNEHKKSWT